MQMRRNTINPLFLLTINFHPNTCRPPENPPRPVFERIAVSPLAISLLAISMSIDAFIAALGRGASSGTPSLVQALKVGAVFGVMETITPLIGWGLGVVASQYIQVFDHWIAFGLLSAVGARMVFHALRRDPEVASPSTPHFGLAATALGTSVDAMAVGVSLAFLEVHILVVAAAIGAVTFVMSTIGILAGRALGQRFGKVAEILGGVALFGLGAMILVTHLTA